ncbi:HNH endonuclease [Falsiroseomonas sp. HW251]|uniref:HNH endonuclease n=1 Tax=Falsiroseomonas sp. HW251 TaxID=3390998 RepID=UPI003D3242AF
MPPFDRPEERHEVADLHMVHARGLARDLRMLPSAEEMVEPGKLAEVSVPKPGLESGNGRRRHVHRVTDPARIGVALQGRSIRNISDAEFGAIARAGLHATLDPANAIARHLDANEVDADTAAALQAPPEEQERRIAQLLVNRKIRDAAFRGAVCAAYDNRCAVTGLRIVNGGGRAEVQAAHIKAVAEGGPDVVQNGIALSATVHWLFDRHLISLTDNYGLLVSHNKVPSELRTLFTRQLDRIYLPADRALWPHLDYVRRHREAFAAS